MSALLYARGRRSGDRAWINGLYGGEGAAGARVISEDEGIDPVRQVLRMLRLWGAAGNMSTVRIE
jgi:hypothetical protein